MTKKNDWTTIQISDEMSEIINGILAKKNDGAYPYMTKNRLTDELLRAGLNALNYMVDVGEVR